MMTFNADTHVSEIAAAIPASVRVFQAFGIDFCCGGKRPLGVVCAERHLPFDEVAGAITDAARPSPEEPRDWNSESLGALADHIVLAYHEPLRAELPRLWQMASHVYLAHGDKSPHALNRLEAILEELTADLEAHMRKEELVLFPILRRLDPRAASTITAQIAAPISVMEEEHDSAGTLLAELRTITAGYVAPAGACATWRGLYTGLAELERDMHVHVHLENNVLFPRALREAAVTDTIGAG